MNLRNIGSWILPQPPEKHKYIPIPRISKFRVEPFGYRLENEDDDEFQPVPKELDALEMAKKYLKKYTSREVAAWLTKQTGRKISSSGLNYRLKSEIQRGRRHEFYRALARRYKEALRQAEKYEQRYNIKEETNWFEQDFYQSLRNEWDRDSISG